jgi:hypothetical protein
VIIPFLTGKKKKKKDCKGTKLAVNITGLHSHFWVPIALQMCPPWGQVLTCFLKVAFPPFTYMNAEDM